MITWTMPKEKQLLLDQLHLVAGGRMDFVVNALRGGGDLHGIIRRILEQRKVAEAPHDA